MNPMDIHASTGCMSANRESVLRFRVGAHRQSPDRGHSAPPLGRRQKQEMQNRRKDPFFQQIPDCNLAPPSRVYRGGEEKAREAIRSVLRLRMHVIGVCSFFYRQPPQHYMHYIHTVCIFIYTNSQISMKALLYSRTGIVQHFSCVLLTHKANTKLSLLGSQKS